MWPCQPCSLAASSRLLGPGDDLKALQGDHSVLLPRKLELEPGRTQALFTETGCGGIGRVKDRGYPWLYNWIKGNPRYRKLCINEQTNSKLEAGMIL